MFLKAILVVLMCGFALASTKKVIKTESQFSLSNGDRTGHHESFTSGQTDSVNLLHYQVKNHEGLLHEAYNLIHQQSQQLLQQEDALHQQADILNKQEKLIQRLLSKHPQLHENTDFPSHFEGVYAHEDASHEENSDSLTMSHTGVNSPVSSSLHRQTRADDNGPLQVFIDRMNQQITVLNAEIQSLKNSYHRIENVQASTFVHWGSSTCSGISDLVYSGFVGGSYYTYSGGGSNYLCLTMHPVPSNRTKPAGAAYLYGSEFFTYDQHAHKDPVCAVCRSKFSTTVMIPGTNICSPGWIQDYEGFLMAGAFNQAGSTQYICVDSKMESKVGGDATQYGMAMYYTVTQCGSLPCEPYETNKVVTCAVCSK